jgi:hypothetical protein
MRKPVIGMVFPKGERFLAGKWTPATDAAPYCCPHALVVACAFGAKQEGNA